ncbi:MAG: mevalonate kinase family protein [Candidatus Helarchaeota archaeon]
MNENSKKKIIQVPGRICLFGDKVDLLEKSVIAATINSLLTIELTPRNDDVVEFYSYDLDTGLKFSLKDPKFNYEHPLKYWSAIVNRLKERISGFRATVRSDIPIGAGLSTSAAISVGLIKGLNELYDLGYKTDQIAELAYVCEHDDLGISCGRMDQYAIAYGGVTFIETGDIPKVERLDIDNLPLVVGNSLEERKAEIILNRIRKQINEKDEIVLGAFKKIEQIVYEGKKAILEGDFKRIGELMNQQQEQENVLQAATEKLNKLCKAAIEAGAYGAKQMGAGGGGCMEAICPNKQLEVKKSIEKAGGLPWIFEIFHYDDAN